LIITVSFIFLLFYLVFISIFCLFSWGIILYNKSIKEHNQIIRQLEKKLSTDKVLPSIRKDFKLSKSFMKGTPIIYFDSSSRGADDYMTLTENILIKIFRSL